jgi:hypothetical protein
VGKPFERHPLGRLKIDIYNKMDHREMDCADGTGSGLSGPSGSTTEHAPPVYCYIILQT